MEKDVIVKAVNIDKHENMSSAITDYRSLLYDMFYIYYDEDEARAMYESILLHKGRLEEKLDKEISFLAAAVDYSDEHSVFLEPRVVEKSLVEKLSEIAIYDSLTGLYKRGVFDSLLEKEIKKHRRYKKPLSVFMLDIDDFKVINDTYGHQEGDKVLRNIGQLMSDNSRLYDIECRYGGEELISILPGTNERQALKIAERLRKDILKHFLSQTYNITVSVGIAQLRDGEELIELVSRVDKALYQAKDAGKNQCRIAV